MNGHVAKPINVSELFATLASMIGKREAFHPNPQCPDFGQSGRGKKDFLKINCYSCGDLR